MRIHPFEVVRDPETGAFRVTGVDQIEPGELHETARCASAAANRIRTVGEHVGGNVALSEILAAVRDHLESVSARADEIERHCSRIEAAHREFIASMRAPFEDVAEHVYAIERELWLAAAMVR